MRVYELARDLGVDSKELLQQAHDLGIEVKTASSGLDEESAELLRLAVAGDESEPEAVEPEEEPVAVPSGKRQRIGEYFASQKNARTLTPGQVSGDIVSCKLGGSTQFMKQPECLSRGGVPGG